MTELEKIVKSFRTYKLEAIVIGNAAAALLGAPVSTLDVDFMIRDTEDNKLKLQNIAKDLDAILSQPFEPASNMTRMLSHDIQVDFIFTMNGISSFESLRSRAQLTTVGGCDIMVASLEDVIKSKRACGREKDLASLPMLEKTLRVKKSLELQ